MSKYGVFSGLYFSVFSPNTGKYGPEKCSLQTTLNLKSSISKNVKSILLNVFYQKKAFDSTFTLGRILLLH